MTNNKKAALAGTGTASNSFDTPKSKHPARIRLLALASTIAAYPMPPALTDAEILDGAAPLGLVGDFLVLSWPDGVRVAIDCHVTAAEGIAIYQVARARIEAGYGQLAEQTGAEHERRH